MAASRLYDQDFYAWANEQAALLRAGKLSEADIEHIAEEVESLGKTEKREFVGRLIVLMVHLLKWRFQPSLRGRNWKLSVDEQRIAIDAHLSDNPSLKSVIPEATALAYRQARIGAQRETDLDAAVFPDQCPWSFEEMMAEDFWPEG
ncbi:DUF29 domain-containing protein [Methylocystis sp.]|uniref:DUF29 domain-containing protein n=1 Tax=Methylocystis sp. TaxID=1911079 RepID=UPI003DA66001